MSNPQPRIWDFFDQVKTVPEKIDAVGAKVDELATKMTASLHEISEAVENGAKIPGTSPADETLIGLCGLCLLAGPDGRWENNTTVGGIFDKAGWHHVTDLGPKATPDDAFNKSKAQVSKERGKLTSPELKLLLDEPVLDLLRRLADRLFNPAAPGGSTSF